MKLLEVALAVATLRPRGGLPGVLRHQDGAYAAAPIRGNIRTLVRLPQ